jgi:hypothetical protein
MQPLNGWIIEISNRHKNQTEKSGAITICSDHGCTGRNLDANGMIYMTTGADGRWSLRGGKLWFQDKECDGDSDDGAACNFFKKVTIRHKKLFGWDRWTGTCGKGINEGKCTIGIGTP